MPAVKAVRVTFAASELAVVCVVFGGNNGN